MWPGLTAVVVVAGGGDAGAWLRVVIALHVMLMQVHCQKHTERNLLSISENTHTHTRIEYVRYM